MKKRISEGIKRRRPKGLKFLSDYYLLRDKILNDEYQEHYSDDEEGRFEYYKTRVPTKNRHLYSLFEYFGKKTIDKYDLIRIKNITNNKMRITHDQILARNFLTLLDNFVTTLLRHKDIKYDYEFMKKEYPWCVLKLKSDYDYFFSTKGQKDESNVLKKYVKLSKILGKLPEDKDFIKIAGISLRKFASIKRLDTFSEEFQERVLSWRYPLSEINKRKKGSNYKMIENKKTSGKMKDLINDVIGEWQKYTEIKLNNDSAGTLAFNDSFDNKQLDHKTRKKPNYDKIDWSKLKGR